MKACRTNSSIRLLTHKGDTIEPVHTSKPSSQDQGQHKLWWKSTHTHTFFPTWKVTGAHTTLNHSSIDGSCWCSAHQLPQKQPLNLQAYLSSFMPGEYTAHNKANHWNLKQFIKYCYLVPVLYSLCILSKMCKNKEMRFLESSQWTVLETNFTWNL